MKFLQQLKTKSSLLRKVRLILSGLFIGILLFGVSIHISRESRTGAITMSLPQIQPIKDVLETRFQGGTPVAVSSPHPWQLVVSGPRKAEAAESSWSFVRQSATWANGNSTIADNLIVSLKNSGLLNTSSPSTIQTTSTISGVSYKIKLETNCSTAGACTGISSSAYTGTKDFSYRFKMWRASDNKDVLEMIFDDVNNPATGDGVLLSYRLAALDTSSATNEDLIVESYISGGAGSRRQTYSWGQAFHSTGSQASNTSDRGRVILEEMTIGLKGGGTSSGALCVRVASRTVSTNFGCGSGNYYYSLAYGQLNANSFETTALSGIRVGDMPASSTLCGADILKFATFNGSGFISDGLASSGIPGGFPDPSVNGGYPGVQALFNKLGTSGNGGNNGYDDTQKATLDSLNSISFHPVSEAPGF
ncbi:MAG: hypothetical protein KDK39_14940 [Leptospiraceae bacterium]|nr:hypothetical protein [Leptospiraceae bacterium]